MSYKVQDIDRFIAAILAGLLDSNVFKSKDLEFCTGLVIQFDKKGAWSESQSYWAQKKVSEGIEAVGEPSVKQLNLQVQQQNFQKAFKKKVKSLQLFWDMLNFVTADTPDNELGDWSEMEELNWHEFDYLMFAGHNGKYYRIRFIDDFFHVRSSDKASVILALVKNNRIEYFNPNMEEDWREDLQNLLLEIGIDYVGQLKKCGLKIDVCPICHKYLDGQHTAGVHDGCAYKMGIDLTPLEPCLAQDEEDLHKTVATQLFGGGAGSGKSSTGLFEYVKGDVDATAQLYEILSDPLNISHFNFGEQEAKVAEFAIKKQYPNAKVISNGSELGIYLFGWMGVGGQPAGKGITESKAWADAYKNLYLSMQLQTQPVYENTVWKLKDYVDDLGEGQDL